MYEQIKNKRALVTGASSGIGKAVATVLAEHGAQVGIHCNSGFGAAFRLRAELKNFSEKTEVLYGDLLSKQVRENLLGKFTEIFGGIDILVNNAGACYEYGHFSQTGEEEWDRMFELHVKAPFTLSKQAFAGMKERNWGRIINISTMSIEHAGPNNMPYYSSKAALDAMTRGFAREGARYNILVNSIRCGIIDTPMRTKIAGYNEEKFAKRVGMIPIGRAGNPLDVARAVLFLASEGGNFITGEILKVAGGE